MSTNTSHHQSNMVVDSWWFEPEHLDTFSPRWSRTQQQICERMAEKEGNQCAAKPHSKSLLKVALQATDLWTVVLAFLRTLSSSAKTVLLIMSSIPTHHPHHPFSGSKYCWTEWSLWDVIHFPFHFADLQHPLKSLVQADGQRWTRFIQILITCSS